MSKSASSMFQKSALIFTALTTLTIADVARPASAVVVSSNGYYGAAWGQYFNAESAIAKATQLCQ